MKVIFNADDFGLTRAVNAGIMEAYEHGLLKSASLMVTAEAADDAVAWAKARPGLDVGLHIALTEERPALPPEQIPSLVTDGRFYPRRGTVFFRYAIGRWDVAEAAAEIAAQWNRLLGYGLEPSHLDGHQHLHLLPWLFPSVIALARGHRIRFVRTRLGDPVAGAGSLARKISVLAINKISRLNWAKTPDPDGLAMIPFTTVGFLQSGGALTVSSLMATLDQLRRDQGQGIVEVMIHPGRCDAETERKYGHWRYRWESDLWLLLDPTLPEALAQRGIVVTSFRELHLQTDKTIAGRSFGVDNTPQASVDFPRSPCE